MDARAVRQLPDVVRQRRVERGELWATAPPRIVSAPPPTKMPPPSAKRPFGAEAIERLPATTLFSSVSCPGSSSRMPPPTASLLSAPPARLSATLVFLSVSTPQLSIPPPPASANRQGPVGQMERGLGTVSAGSARLPEMTLSLIVTVAPVASSAAGGISMPPPSAVARSKSVAQVGPQWALEVVRPPVIVRRRIATRRLGRGAQDADRQHRAAAADRGCARARADQGERLVDRDPTREAAAAHVDDVAVVGRVDRGLDRREAVGAASHAERIRARCGRGGGERWPRSSRSRMQSRPPVSWRLLTGRCGSPCSHAASR